MNAVNDFDRTPASPGIRHDADAAGRPFGLPVEDLRLITSGLVGREAAITAGHLALVRLVTTKRARAVR